MEHAMVVIDGSHGEGGGQVLRTALTLSVLAGIPVEVFNLRRKRPRPGLRPQHLAAVKAAASICRARCEGVQIGSLRVVFTPGPVMPGRYHFEIGTAGSAVLVLQTVLPPLCLAQAPSRVTVVGGTHVPWSPSFHYFDEVFRPATEAIGLRCACELKKWGWYPAGGGVIEVRTEPRCIPLKPFQGLECNRHRGRIRTVIATSSLPAHVGGRMESAARSAFAERGWAVETQTLEVPALSPGGMVFCRPMSSGYFGGVAALAARGKPAEQVAGEAAAGLATFLESEACVDHHLSDQLLVPALCAQGISRWSTSAISTHLRTNAWVAAQFGLGPIDFAEDNRGRGMVTVTGRGVGSV